MDVAPVVPKGLPLVAAYGNGGFKIGEEHIAGSIRISADGVASWPATDFKRIAVNDFAFLQTLNPKPEILIIGTGKQHAALPNDIKNLLRGQGISSDAMDTGAACRTYNVLAAEGRRVAAALIAID